MNKSKVSNVVLDKLKAIVGSKNFIDDVKNIIDEQIEKYGSKNPQNLEEQALSLVGKDIYETLIKEYTEKQWGKKCKDLPASIIKRIPVRFTWDNNYFN